MTEDQTKGFNANELLIELNKAGVKCDSAEIAIISGAKNREVFEMSAVFHKAHEKPHKISTTVTRETATKQSLPAIVQDIKNQQ